MATTQQTVWLRKTTAPGVPKESQAKYNLGPQFDPAGIQHFRTRKFLSSSTARSKRRQRSRLYPTTSTNYWDRISETQRLGPTTNGIAAFTHISDLHTKLWVTTYPYSQPNKTRIFGPQETLIFHVHAADGEAGLNWGFPPDSAATPFWRRVVTRTQFATARTAEDSDDDDDFNKRDDRFINDGPIMRPDNDILYLDKTFWRQYFQRLDQNVDILIPGVFPEDLAYVEKIAVDIAVLRSKEEFTTVAKAVRRHLPSVKVFRAVVTNLARRPAQVPVDQIAHFDDGLPVTDEQKVLLGVHEGGAYAPTRGVVTANLNRLKIIGGLNYLVQVKYVQMTYFNDAAGALHGAQFAFDIDSTDLVSIPHYRLREAKSGLLELTVS